MIQSGDSTTMHGFSTPRFVSSSLLLVLATLPHLPILPSQAHSWSKCSFVEDSAPFSFDVVVGGQPLSDIEGHDRLASLPTSGPTPRTGAAATVMPGSSSMYVVGGKLAFGDDVGMKEPSYAHPISELWLLEEVKAEEGAASQHRWTQVECTGAAAKISGHTLAVALPYPEGVAQGHSYTSSFPWKVRMRPASHTKSYLYDFQASPSLVLSGGASDGAGAAGLQTLYYANIGQEKVTFGVYGHMTPLPDPNILQGSPVEWAEFNNELWRPPPPLTGNLCGH